MTVTSKFLCCKYIYLTLSSAASSEVQRCWCSLPAAARVFYSMNIHYIRLAQPGPATYSGCAVGMDLRIHTSTLGAHADNNTTTPQQWGSFTNNLSGDVPCISRPTISYWCDKVPGVHNVDTTRDKWHYVQYWKIIRYTTAQQIDFSIFVIHLNVF